MFKRTYKRKPLTEQHKRAISEGHLRSPKAMKASRENAYKMGKAPKTEKQRENAKKALAVSHKLPRTQKQLEACRENGHKVGNLPKGLVCHHNDLCHGRLRPDDIIYMSHEEHMRFHTTLRNNLRVKDGTHPFLKENRGAWKVGGGLK